MAHWLLISQLTSPPFRCLFDICSRYVANNFLCTYTKYTIYNTTCIIAIYAMLQRAEHEKHKEEKRRKKMEKFNNEIINQLHNIRS